MTDQTEKVYREVAWNDPVIIEAIKDAPIYKKKGEVKATIATGEETANILLPDGTAEERKIADPGDFIIISPRRTTRMRPKDFNNGYRPKEGCEGTYEATGYCKCTKNPIGENITLTYKTDRYTSSTNVDADYIVGLPYDPKTGSLKVDPETGLLSHDFIFYSEEGFALRYEEVKENSI